MALNESRNDAPTAGGESGLATRRRVLDWLLLGSFLSWMAVIVFPILKYLKRPAEASGRGRLVLSDDEKKKIIRERFAIVRLGTDRVIVFEDRKNHVHALQAKCTHEGCTVTYKSDEDLIWCACHNGKFGIDGHVISGPPPKPLPSYVVEGDLASKLSISRQGA